MAYYRTYSWISADATVIATACTNCANAFVDALVANEGFTLINYSAPGSVVAFIERNGLQLEFPLLPLLLSPRAHTMPLLDTLISASVEHGHR